MYVQYLKCNRLSFTVHSVLYLDWNCERRNIKGESRDLPGEHVVVLRADGGRVGPARPVEDNLLVRGAGPPEHRVVVAVVEVAPEAGVGGGDVVTSEDGGRHPQVVQLGQDLAVQVGEVRAREEGGGQGREELVQEGEGDLQGLAVTCHRLKRRLHDDAKINITNNQP